jgi:hypothetical protein
MALLMSSSGDHTIESCVKLLAEYSRLRAHLYLRTS